MVSANEGTCNRHAPKPSQAIQGEVWAEWPLVMPSDWCGEWAAPLSDDELFADFIARNASSLPTFNGIDELFADFIARNASSLPTFNGIPVLPTDQPHSTDPLMITYDHPFEDPLR
jgi:hypothetical protein